MQLFLGFGDDHGDLQEGDVQVHDRFPDAFVFHVIDFVGLDPLKAELFGQAVADPQEIVERVGDGPVEVEDQNRVFVHK